MAAGLFTTRMERMTAEDKNENKACFAPADGKAKNEAGQGEIYAPITLWQLFILFFKVSAVTFGGGIVILAMIKLEVEKRKNMSQEELEDMISLVGSVPGPMAVSMSWLFGYSQQGLPGALAALAGAILPPFLIVLFLSPIVLEYSGVPAVQGFFKGVLCGVSALIVITIFGHVKGTLTAGLWNLLPFAAVIIFIGVFRIHPFAAMLMAMALQIVRERVLLK